MLNKNEETLNSKIWASIEKIARSTQLGSSEISSILDLKEKDYIKLKKSTEILSVQSIAHLCEEIEIDEESFIKGDFSTEVLEKRYLQNDYLSIPQKYLECAYSKMFTIRHIYELAKFIGKGDFLLRKLQVTEQALAQDISVSCEMVSDAFRAIAPYVYDRDFAWVGAKNVFLFKDAFLGKSLGQARGFQELFEIWLGEEHFFEENWSYKIESVRDNSIQIGSYATPRLIEHFKSKKYSSIETAKCRAAFAGYLPTYIGLPMAEAKILKTVHQEDPYCLFEITLNKITPQLRTKLASSCYQ